MFMYVILYCNAILHTVPMYNLINYHKFTKFLPITIHVHNMIPKSLCLILGYKQKLIIIKYSNTNQKYEHWIRKFQIIMWYYGKNYMYRYGL